MPLESFEEYLQRDPLEGDRVRVVVYRREVAVDQWLDTTTGKTFTTPSRTRSEQLVRVGSSPPLICDTPSLSDEKRRLAVAGWCPPEPILLRRWSVVPKDGSLVCPRCGSTVRQPRLPQSDVCVCERGGCQWRGVCADLMPATLRGATS